MNIPAHIQHTCQQAQSAYFQQQYAWGLQLLQPIAHAYPHWFEVQNLYGALLERTGQYPAAIAAFEAALIQRPDDVGICGNLARCYLQNGDFEQAWQLYQRALSQPINHQPDILKFAGLAASRTEEHDAAIRIWQDYLRLRPYDAQTHYNIAASQQALGDTAAARSAYQKALRLDPRHELAQMNFLFNEHYDSHSSPAAIAALTRDLGRALAQSIQPYTHWLSPCRADKTPLRIGLVSPDLHEHPVGYFLSGLLEHSQPDTLQWLAFSDCQTQQLSPWAQALHSRFTAVHNTRGQSDASVAQLIHAQGIDILLDLTGWGRGQRMGVFAHKPAPVQLAAIGYFATTGLPTMDGVLADSSLAPEEEVLFTEKIWRLPHTRLCYQPRPEMADSPITALPALQKGHVTFGCFQNLSKINDSVLQAWAQIACAAPSAHWRIQSPQLSWPASRKMLLERLAKAGMPLERVHLVGRQSFAEYLSSHAEADLLLDTFPYPGGTTTLESLWMGLPTLTLATPGMLGRQGQGLLSAANMDPFWICNSQADYIQRAQQLAHAPQWPALQTLRQQLRQQLASSPAFNSSPYAAECQTLLRQIWQHACRTRPWGI